MSAATSRSVRPGRSHSRHPRRAPRSIACPAAAQRLDLGGGLAHPQLAQRRRRPGAARRRGSAARKREHLLGPHPVVEADRPGVPPSAAGDQRVRVVGLGVVDDLARRRAPARPGRRAAPGAGTTRNGSPSAGSTRQVSRSSGVRVVAGEVPQVGAGRDEQRVEPGRGGGELRGTKSLFLLGHVCKLNVRLGFESTARRRYQQTGVDRLARGVVCNGGLSTQGPNPSCIRIEMSSASHESTQHRRARRPALRSVRP